MCQDTPRHRITGRVDAPALIARRGAYSTPCETMTQAMHRWAYLSWVEMRFGQERRLRRRGPRTRVCDVRATADRPDAWEGCSWPAK